MGEQQERAESRSCRTIGMSSEIEPNTVPRGRQEEVAEVDEVLR